MNFQNQIDSLKQDGYGMLDDYPLTADIDRDILNSEIMLRCGLLTPLYSEPMTMYMAINHWFGSRDWTIRHLVNIIESEYSPIENTDYTLETSRQIYQSGASGNTRTRNLDGSVDNTNLRTDRVSAYDASTFSNSAQVEGEAGATTEEDETITDSGTTSGQSADTYKERKHGNIGVTTNQQLITQELSMLQQFTLYKWIAMQLEAELFIMVY